MLQPIGINTLYQLSGWYSLSYLVQNEQTLKFYLCMVNFLT